MPDPADYPLYRSQTAVMAAIMRYTVQEGYRYWMVATAPEERILGAVWKLHQRHLVLLDKGSRHYRRTNRLPTAHLVLAAEPAGGLWPYALLANRPLEGERMARLAPQRPLTWPAFREGEWRPTYALRLDERGRWTWYLVEDFHRLLLEEALHWADKGDWPRLVGHLKTLGRLPMYRGIFSQVQEIRKRVQKLWGDRHLRDPGGQWKAPPWRKALEEWPKGPLSPTGMRLYVGEEEGRPRTLGEWAERRRG